MESQIIASHSFLFKEKDVTIVRAQNNENNETNPLRSIHSSETSLPS